MWRPIRDYGLKRSDVQRRVPRLRQSKRARFGVCDPQPALHAHGDVSVAPETCFHLLIADDAERLNALVR